MEWGVKENHVAVTALHSFGKCYSQTFKLLKGFKISCMFVYRATKHYEEHWRVEERALLGHLRRLRAQAASKTVQEQIRRNPLWKRKITSRELNILIHWKSHIIRDDQHITVYHLSKGHILTPALKAIRWTRTEHLLQWRGMKTSFSWRENLLNIKEQYNHENNQIYAEKSHEVKENVLRVHRSHHPSYVMVWSEVSQQVVTDFHFCKKRTETGVQVCQEDVLQGVVKQLKMTLFSGLEWVFQH